MFFLEHGHCAVTEPASKKSSFVSALKCVLVYFAVAFFVLSGTTHAQQTVTCSTHRPSDPPTDKDALIALYCATDGDNWTNSGNWLTDMPLGNWHGVTLDRLGGVQYLHLQENELSGTIPPQLGNLTNLLQLYLWSNNLEGSIPSELGNLSELVVLYLDKNELTGTIPTELGKLPNLRNNLGLSQNQLEGSIPSELGNLTELQVLDLRDNKLTGSIPPELEKLGSTSRYGGMKELFLSQNQLDGSIPTWLGRLTSLQQLYLSQNQLTGSIPTELENLTDLQRLYLNNNMLTGAIPTELETLTQLREFYLGDNQLTGTIPTWLGDLTNLEYLNLSNNSLNGTIPTELGNLTSLQSLFLQDNGLSEEIPTELGNLTNLELLGLWGNEELTWDTISNELGKSADRAVLGYLYGVNGGEDWSNNDNWFSSEEDQTEISSSWYGVGVNSDGRVSELNLAKNNLKEKLTNALEALDSLETLNLSDNPELTGTLPERLMNLLFLETLDIRCTGVSTPADTDFKMWLSRISFQEGPCPPPPSPPSPPSSSPPSPPPSPPPSLNPSESPEGTVSITDNEEVALSPKNEGGSIDLGNGKTIELTVTRDEDLPPSSGNPSIILSPDLLDRIDEITFELSADSPEAAPSGFRLGGFVADIDLGVELEKGETVTVCLPAPEGDGESALYHYDERQGMWIRLASRVETISGERLVCAETDALSLFGVFVAEQSRPPVNPPTTGGGTQGGGGCAIASNGVKGNMFSSVLLNLLLMLSVPFLVASRKRR